MNQALLGTITKSPKEIEFIKGPIISLTRKHSMIIVDYFKKSGKWTSDFLNDNALLIPSELIFKIYNPQFLDRNFDYYFDAYVVDEFFFGDSNDFHLGLIRYSFDRKKIEVICLGKNMKKRVYDFSPKANYKEGLEINQDNWHIFQDKPIASFYDFNFSNSVYLIEEIDLKDYIIFNHESWWGLTDLTFLPFQYINY